MSPHSALLIIDFINDIVHHDGKLASCSHYVAEHNVLQHANKAISWARQHAILLCHIKVGFSANYIECPAFSPLFAKSKELQALQLNTWGCEFHAAMDVQTHDAMVVKHRISALTSNGLLAILGANQINTLILSGVATDLAIEATARAAHDMDYQVIVLEDACGAHDMQNHQAALRSIARIAQVTNVANLVNQQLV